MFASKQHIKKLIISVRILSFVIHKKITCTIRAKKTKAFICKTIHITGCTLNVSAVNNYLYISIFCFSAFIGYHNTTCHTSYYHCACKYTCHNFFAILPHIRYLTFKYNYIFIVYIAQKHFNHKFSAYSKDMNIFQII